jgi:RHS repeat-associated protein
MYERTTDGITTRYYYDGQDIIAEGTVKADKTVELKAKYLRGADGLIARISDDTAGKVSYYHKNGHGDVLALRDRNGNLLNSYSYDIWGNPLADKTTETVSNPFRYSGEYWDKSTSLQYLRARWYDPSMGRFISEDTYEGDFKSPISLNLYTYVENNPLKYIDPSGHKPQFEERDGGGARNPNAHSVTDNWIINTLENLTPLGAIVTLQDKEAGIADKLIGLFALVPLGKVAGKADEIVSIFRAVGPDEFYDIMNTFEFKVDPKGKGFQGGKQFAMNFDEVLGFADKFSDIGAIVEVKIPKDVLEKLAHFTNVDPFLFKSGSVTIHVENLGDFNKAIKKIFHKF